MRTKAIVAACLLTGLFLGWLIMGAAQGEALIRSDYDVPHGYIDIRPGGVAADEDVPGAATGDWYTIDKDGWVAIPEGWTTLTVSIYGYGDGDGAGSPDAGSCDVNLYVARFYGGAIPVGSYSWNFGTCQLSTNPVTNTAFRTSRAADANYVWGEGPPVADANSWPADPVVSGATNKVGEVTFGRYGATHIRPFFDNLTGVTRVHAVMTGRKD